jgi:hypothetical protein
MNKKNIDEIPELEPLEDKPRSSRRLNGEEEISPLLGLSAQDSDDIRLEELIFSLQGSSYSFALYRKRIHESKERYVGRVQADNFDLENVKQVWGGGEYRAKVYGANGRYAKHFSFAIDESSRGSQDTPHHGGNNVDSVELARTVAEFAKPTDSSPMIIAMMEKQSSQGAQFMQLMMQMQAESAKTMMTVMGTMFSSKQSPQGDGFSSAITPILVKMIESSSNKSSGLDVKGLIELRDLLAPPERDEKPTIVDRLLDAAPALLPLFFGGSGGGISMGKPQQFLPVGDSQSLTPPDSGVPCPPKSPAGNPPSSPPASEELPLIPLLKRGAVNNSEPDSYALVVLDLVGESNEKQLLEVLQSPTWEKGFLMFDEKEMVWIKEWRSAVIDILTGNDDDEDEVDAVAPK